MLQTLLLLAETVPAQQSKVERLRTRSSEQTDLYYQVSIRFGRKDGTAREHEHKEPSKSCRAPSCKISECLVSNRKAMSCFLHDVDGLVPSIQA